MALTGTLSDIGVIDLIQFPNKGRRTGELIIASSNSESRLYYVEGNLIHAISGNQSGLDALVEVVSLTEGEFEFRSGVEAEQKTLTHDLHRTLMMALKTRDERMEEVRKNKNRTDTAKLDSPKVLQALEGIVLKTPYVQGGCILAPDGALIAEAEAEDAEKGRFAKVRESIAALYKHYEASRLTRTFLEDDLGVIHASGLPSGRGIAVIAANRETSMGQLSLMMNRLISAIGESGQ
jgi:predicted regulator of Ras-like GTPase activity (Roadblock/LC7/MglB family)